MIYGR